MTELRTPRLLLRPWQDTDFEPFSAMNADPRVMEHYPSVLTREQSDRFIRDRILTQFELSGYGPWAVEVPGVTPFAGYVGLLEHSFEAPFTPCVEVGWRLAFRHWGHGYATEGARAALTYGFDVVGLDEIVSFTTVTNARSIAMMERLGMTRVAEFEHPQLPHGHPLRQHVLYHQPAATWDRTASKWRHSDSSSKTAPGRYSTAGFSSRPMTSTSSRSSWTRCCSITRVTPAFS